MGLPCIAVSTTTPNSVVSLTPQNSKQPLDKKLLFVFRKFGFGDIETGCSLVLNKYSGASMWLEMVGDRGPLAPGELLHTVPGEPGTWHSHRGPELGPPSTTALGCVPGQGVLRGCEPCSLQAGAGALCAQARLGHREPGEIWCPKVDRLRSVLLLGPG